jgi:hypothetical protein
MTAPAEAAAETVTVTAAATRVGLVGTLIGAAGSKLGITAATAIVAAALTIGGVAALTGNNSGSSRGLGLNKETFEYPYELLDAHDDGGDGWHAWKRSGTGERGPVQMVPVAPGMDRATIYCSSSGEQMGSWLVCLLRMVQVASICLAR